MFIPDKFARTVRFLVKIVDGQVMLIDGKPLPKMTKDARGELVLFSVFSLADEEDRAFYAAEHMVPFFSKGTVFWARVNSDPISDELKKFRISKETSRGEAANFVQFVLEEDLGLILRPGKNSVLNGCGCLIPGLNEKAKSVNEAYTKISTAFEPKRRSHTGNAFQCVYVDENGKLVPLEDARMKASKLPIEQMVQPQLSLG